MDGVRWRLIESHPLGRLNYFSGAFLLGFICSFILICLVLRLYLIYLRKLPCVCSLLAKMDSGEEAHGYSTSLTMR